MNTLIILTVFLSSASLVLGIVILASFNRNKNSKDETIGPKLDSIGKDFTIVSTRLDEMNRANVNLHQTVETKLSEIRNDNERRMEEMRRTVEEKLQTTLENRLSTTFKTVSDQLEQVYKQLGEMQNLAKGVGNLERVLTNVKTRGMWGELQAERILQEILTPDQYVKNVATKHGSKDVVEFAVKLPGTDAGQPVFLPIDSKFPREDYERLCDATERGDVDLAKELRTALESRIKREAKDICDKYLDVPYTTDFGILFLPIEGLYAEVLSIAGLQEIVQHDFHVLIAGPATLASLLNSLQMGFRTLAIEKKSAEVWNVLGQVKTEFGRFEVTLQKVQDKLSQASNEVERAFVRQRAMNRKLKGVEAVDLPVAEEVQMIDSDTVNEDLD